MSRFEWKADGILEGAEGRFMTQSVNREFFELDRFSLVSPPYSGLETIRNQTLPRAITDLRASHQADPAASAYFGGFPDDARGAAYGGGRGGQRIPLASRPLYVTTAATDIGSNKA